MIAAARPLRLTTGRLTTGRLTTGRLTTGLLAAGLLTAVLLATGCDDTARAPIVDLELDLAPCLGEAPGRGDGIDRPTRCRASLDATVGRGDVNACLLAREATPGAPTRALPMQWHAGRLRPAIDDPLLDLPPGRPLVLALFLLTAADDTGAPCATLSIEQPCASDPRCVLKLTEDDVLPGAEPVRFTDPNGACAAEPGAPLAALEACNATDDDCDGKPDEGITCHPCPPEGCPACAVPDDCRDSPDQPICAASEGDPRCRPCREAAECAALDRGLEGCVDGRCTPCDVTRRDACDATPGCADGTCRCIAGECEPCDPTDCACTGGAERPECLGATCQPEADDCATGHCIDRIHRCGRRCNSDDVCDAHTACVELPNVVDQWCVTRCDSDVDCPLRPAGAVEQEVCRYRRLGPDHEYVGVCDRPNFDARPVGDRCTRGVECVHGLCLDDQDLCTRPCARDEHCPVDWYCAAMLVLNGATINGCVPDSP